MVLAVRVYRLSEGLRGAVAESSDWRYHHMLQIVTTRQVGW